MTWTLLHEAAEHLDLNNVIEQCHLHPDELVFVDDHGSTPLHVACLQSPPSELVKALVDACPQVVKQKDSMGDTPLIVTLSNSTVDPDVVRILLDADQTVASVTNKEGLMPLHQACRYCVSNEKVIALLLDVYPAAARYRIKMGELAPRSKRESLVEVKETDHFIPEGSPRTVTNSLELRYQALSEQIRDGSYPLHMALASGASLNVVEMFLKGAPDVVALPNKHGELPIHIALAKNESDEVVEALVKAHSSLKLGEKDATSIAEKRYGNTPLHTAAIHGCSAHVAKALIVQYPSTIHQENNHGKTPLELALDAGKCTPDVIHLLKISDESE